MQQLILWQLINSNFPLGAYNYSEGLEYLVESAGCSEVESFQDWLGLHLRYGSIRAEVSIVLRIVQAIASGILISSNIGIPGSTAPGRRGNSGNKVSRWAIVY